MYANQISFKIICHNYGPFLIGFLIRNNAKRQRIYMLVDNFLSFQLDLSFSHVLVSLP